jgi:hypothetical protein
MMSRPRAFEYGEGWVPNLRPSGEQIRLMQAALAERKSGSGTVAMSRYRHALESQWREQKRLLRPGQLLAVQPVFPNGTTVDETPEVADGDTVCCACSRAHAAAGLCHRTWAAPFLVRAGWRVVLDGREVPQ